MLTLASPSPSLSLALTLSLSRCDGCPLRACCEYGSLLRPPPAAAPAAARASSLARAADQSAVAPQASPLQPAATASLATGSPLQPAAPALCITQVPAAAAVDEEMAEAPPPTGPLIVTQFVPAAGTIASPAGVASVAPAVTITAAVAPAAAAAAAAVATAAITAPAALSAPAAPAAPAVPAAPAAAVADTSSCGRMIISAGVPGGGEAGGEAGPSVLDVNGGPVGCYPATTRPAGYHRNATPAARAVLASIKGVDTSMPASVPPAPRSGKATIDGNYQLLYAREVHDDAR